MDLFGLSVWMKRGDVALWLKGGGGEHVFYLSEEPEPWCKVVSCPKSWVVCYLVVGGFVWWCVVVVGVGLFSFFLLFFPECY